MQAASDRRNRLAGETSPYLLQHADNPVDWYPWGDEALEAAERAGKPVLLSIGYSACHWCHVMAHESFEDPETAALMNELFVNVKVDREERPDLDRIYQTAHQLLTRRPGGWPLTMFIEPGSQRPFFGGTYFPKEPRYGMPSFGDLIERVAAYYREHREEVRRQGDELTNVLHRISPAPDPGAAPLDGALLLAAREQMARGFDSEYGGFGGAPKFPQPSGLDRLLRHWAGTRHTGTPDLHALHMATVTLTRMAEGGLYDQVGGGFCRYSVDGRWEIPHFEKMLYDNGPLLALYAQAAVATGEPLFRRIAGETAAWMIDDMRCPEGGFYASRDADSDGEEGSFYLWTPDEVQGLIPASTWRPFARHFGLDGEPNFEGRWHLVVRKSLADVAVTENDSPQAMRAAIDAARAALRAARASRVPPERDEKILVSWNALAIRGLAIAGRVLPEPALVSAASRAVDFIAANLWRDGRLLAAYKDGSARFPAYLDDHAFLLDALLELLQADWRSDRLELAVSLADLLLDRFEDRHDGGFFFTADDHEALMHRPKPLADESMPSGNGIAAFALQRLGFLLGETRYLEAAARTLRCAAPSLAEYPQAHVSLLTALEEYLHHPEIVIIRGTPGEAARWRAELAAAYAPRRLVFAIPADANDLPGSLASRRPSHVGTVAYRCIGSECSLPATSRGQLRELLGEPH